MRYVETGRRIKQLRLALGINQRQLARAIGIAPPSLSELETGKTKEPSGPVLARLCKALGTNQDFLITGKGSSAAYTQAGVTPPAQSELSAIFEQLPPAGRAALLAAARGMRDSFSTDTDDTSDK